MAVEEADQEENIMLELHTFGPHFNMPDGSPFCIKALMLMKLSGLAFETRQMSFKKAPKGKAPYLVDGNQTIGDSHFIKTHLETTYGIDFSAGYSPDKQAIGWAAARMMEEHMYFLNGYERWMVDENFWKGPIQFFKEVPAPIRPLIARMVRKKAGKTHQAQGLGRHNDEERFELAKGNLVAVEAILGRNKYFLGDRVSGADASVFPFIWTASTPYFKSRIADYVRTRPVLEDYLKRMKTEFFHEYQNG
jgi:glutathione S-transferase